MAKKLTLQALRKKIHALDETAKVDLMSSPEVVMLVYKSETAHGVRLTANAKDKDKVLLAMNAAISVLLEQP